MPKVQLLRFLNLSDAPEVLPPGDMRLWKALGQSLPEIKFLSFRVLGIDWDESASESLLPDISFWNEAMGASGVSTLALSSDCDLPCLQRRRQGVQSSELETLIVEYLREQGFQSGFEVWEAVHFEMQTSMDTGLLEDSVNKLLALESRSGLFDKDAEELRFVRPGESWSWSRRDELASHEDISISDLLTRFKSATYFYGPFDPFRRSYTIREQQPRGPSRTRQEPAFKDRLQKLQKRSESSNDSAAEGFLPPGVLSALVSFHRYSDPALVMRDVDSAFRSLTRFSDDDIGVVQWLNVPYHRTLVHSIFHRRQNFSKSAETKGKQLFALSPLHSSNALLWRRLSAALDLYKDIFADLPWVFSGRETWLSCLRSLMASSRGWEISETALRQVFQWEAERSVPQKWIVFASEWNDERVRDTFRDFGFEVTSLGHVLDDKDSFVVKSADGSLVERSWADILPQLSDGVEEDAVTFAWTSPDIKTPTYGFEKVSIFPDQYLLRLTNPGVRGGLSRRIQFEWRSSARAREVSMRAPLSMPLSGLKWAGSGKQACVSDAFADAWAVATVDPKAASTWAVEACYRQLVARGVDPRKQIKASFFLNKPSLSGSEEKDAQNFGSYSLAVEGFFESMDALENLELGEVALERGSSAIKEYECEPVVSLRANVEPNIQAVLPGFRMTGEALYAVGPRPAFMDIGSRILQHVRVVSNHVTRLNWVQQLELYELIHGCIKDQIITDIRPIFSGGISETLLEMGLWSGIGVQLKPSLSTVELFSGAPGRFLVGILPQEAKRFESIIKSEWLTPVGTTGGEKLFGLPLERYREERIQRG